MEIKTKTYIQKRKKYHWTESTGHLEKYFNLYKNRNKNNLR
jgi:hypothetical protein